MCPTDRVNQKLITPSVLCSLVILYGFKKFPRLTWTGLRALPLVSHTVREQLLQLISRGTVCMNTNDQFSGLLGINEVMCKMASGIVDPVITVVLVVFCFNTDIARLTTRSNQDMQKWCLHHCLLCISLFRV